MRRQKNWKISNQNFNEIQQLNQYNRSCLNGHAHKYLPIKNQSQQKIFSKSKQRLNCTNIQNSRNNSFLLKGITLDLSKRTNNLRQPCLNPGAKHCRKGIKTQNNQENNNSVQNHHKALNFTLHQSRQQHLNLSRNKSRKNQVSFSVNSKRQKNGSFNYFKDYFGNSQHKKKIGKQINLNTQIIIQLKEQFEIFRLLILDELSRQKQFIRRTVQQILTQIYNNKQAIKDEVQLQTEVQKFVVRQQGKNSTEIKIQQLHRLRQNQLNIFPALNDSIIEKILTFGIIEQLTSSRSKNDYQKASQKISDQNNDSGKSVNLDQQHKKSCSLYENIEERSLSHQILTWQQTQNLEQGRQNIIKELKQCESTEQFTVVISGSQKKMDTVKDQNAGIHTIEKNTKNTNSNKIIPGGEQNKRYSDMLKKQYEQSKKISQAGRSSRNYKLQDRMDTLSKFNGAMIKLKAQMLEIKNISDTLYLKKIRFSDNFIGQIK